MHTEHGDVADQAKEEIRAVGERLRDLRTSRHLSLSHVASECNISTSLLSQVERGLVSPSLNTLYVIAHFYNLNLFELFDDERQNKMVQVTRASDRRIVRFGESPNGYELITPAHLTSMSVFELVVHSNDSQQCTASHTPSGITHQGDECLLVLSGQVKVILAGTTYSLESGDAIYYDGTIPHGFANEWHEPSRILVITQPAV